LSEVALLLELELTKGIGMDILMFVTHEQSHDFYMRHMARRTEGKTRN